jgi:biopolymer transport protein ExbD
MAGVSQGGRGRGGIVGINVTPMVDVVLVLLVIMMVSATYIVSQSLKVELPKTASSDEAVQTVAAVTITKDRKLYFNGDPVTEMELVQKLRVAKGKGADVNLVVSADQDVPHGQVVHVIDVAKVEGITKFSINVEQTK